MSGKNKSKSSHVFNTKKRGQNKRSFAKTTTASKPDMPTAAPQEQETEPTASPQSSPYYGEEMIREKVDAGLATIEKVPVQYSTDIERQDAPLFAAKAEETTAFTETRIPELKDVAINIDTKSDIQLTTTEASHGLETSAYLVGSSGGDLREKADSSQLPPATATPDAQFSGEPPPGPLGRVLTPIVIKTCVPSSGHAMKVTGDLTLSPAFLSSYRNEQVPLRPDLSDSTTPAYARPSMSHWFSNPANKIARDNLARGIRSTLPPARAGKKRPLSESSFLRTCQLC
jgi:hypothetical protein